MAQGHKSNMAATLVSPATNATTWSSPVRSSSRQSQSDRFCQGSVNDFPEGVNIETIVLHADGISSTGTGATTYAIEVQLQGCPPWVIHKRYSEVRKLRDDLKSASAPAVHPKFPRKHFVRNHNPRVLEQRRRELQVYLTRIVEIPLFRPELLNFLCSLAYQRIPDKYHSEEEVREELRNMGLHSSDLIIAVDFTKSNLWMGWDTFGGRSLHYVDTTGCVINPYQVVISAITRVFEFYDANNLIPVFGYGGYPQCPLEERYFPFVEGGCELDEVPQRYFEVASTMELNAPASFVPVIHEAIKLVKTSRRYHILIIISNGTIDDSALARQAIVEASEYPISIIMVGVGDGPWTMMKEFDDGLPERKFDNFQFVNYNTIPSGNRNSPDGGFALQALMEIPEQYNKIRELGLIQN